MQSTVHICFGPALRALAESWNTTPSSVLHAEKVASPKAFCNGSQLELLYVCGREEERTTAEHRSCCPGAAGRSRTRPAGPPGTPGSACPAATTALPASRPRAQCGTPAPQRSAVHVRLSAGQASLLVLTRPAQCNLPPGPPVPISALSQCRRITEACNPILHRVPIVFQGMLFISKCFLLSTCQAAISPICRSTTPRAVLTAASRAPVSAQRCKAALGSPPARHVCVC